MRILNVAVQIKLPWFLVTPKKYVWFLRGEISAKTLSFWYADFPKNLQFRNSDRQVTFFMRCELWPKLTWPANKQRKRPVSMIKSGPRSKILSWLSVIMTATLQNIFYRIFRVPRTKSKTNKEKRKLHVWSVSSAISTIRLILVSFTVFWVPSSTETVLSSLATNSALFLKINSHSRFISQNFLKKRSCVSKSTHTRLSRLGFGSNAMVLCLFAVWYNLFQCSPFEIQKKKTLRKIRNVFILWTQKSKTIKEQCTRWRKATPTQTGSLNKTKQSHGFWYGFSC